MRRASPPSAPTVAAAPATLPAGTQALAPTTSAGPATKRTEIKPGMTTTEVRAAFGDPEAEVVFGGKTQWTYPGLTVVFVGGKVTDVKF